MAADVYRAIVAALIALSASLSSQQDQVAQIMTAVESLAPPVVLVRTAAGLQQAIDTAAAGTTIRLYPGVIYVGTFILRNRPGDAVTTITTDGPLPEGRMTADPMLAVLCSPDREPPLRTEAGAHHYALVGVEVCEVNGGYASIAIGTNEETAAGQFPHHITLDRIRLAATGQQRRGIMAIGAAITISNSLIAGIKYSGEDSQAIWGNGPGPYLIENNDLEAAGENILFGGADPKTPMLVPTDITIRGNWLHKPLAWRGTAATVKNLLELKNARQVRITDNVLDTVWAGAQNGYAVLFTPRNQGGQCPWCVVEDVTFERNLVRHAAGGVNVLGVDDEKPSLRTNRIRIQQNAFLDIGSAWGTGGWVFIVGAGPTDVVIDHNTVRQASSRGVLMAYGTPAAGFVYTNNVALADAYGVFGDGTGTGTAAMTRYFPGGVLLRNILAGAVARDYPATFGSYPSVTSFTAHFASPTSAVITGTDWTDAGANAAQLPGGGQ